MDDWPPEGEVDAEWLRGVFNDGHYYQRALDGELDVERDEDDHPSLHHTDLPNCTRSQTFLYWDKETGELVALVHQYRLPDGRIGGSGLPDPKRMVVDGRFYYVTGEESRD